MTNENGSRDQAAAQLSSISRMLAALNCDYDRLAELREDRADLTEEESEELAELEQAAGGCEDRDDAEQRIQEDPLTVEVRSAWYSPGDSDGQQPSEFQILLCTGGPAVRIIGELDEYGQPSRAWLEHQDWGTPWTHYYESGSNDVLVEYASQFYFGE